MSKVLVIRADATPDIGAGHVMRCLALAQAWASNGNSVILVGRITIPWICERLRTEQIDVEFLEEEIEATQNFQHLFAVMEKYTVDWVVFDGYHFTYADQKSVRDAGYKLLVIDDCNHLPEYCCNILLNQNVGAERYSYQGSIGHKLLGIEYILLRQEVLNAIPIAMQKQTELQVRNVLLTLGGGDMEHRFDMLRDLFKLPMWSGVSLRVVAGGTSLAAWDDLLQRCSAQVEVIKYASDMAELMLWADFTITAGGSTCWELCALQSPFSTIVVAENQRDVVNYLESNSLSTPVSLLPDVSLQQAAQLRPYLKGLGQFYEKIVSAMAAVN